MKHFLLITIILVRLPLYITYAQTDNAKDDLKFNTLDSLYSYAEENSYVIKTNQQNTLLAKYQKVAALANVINFRDPLVFSMNDNTKLPVSFIPGELLGGAPGTFKHITLGQQYVSNVNITPQIDIINPGNWAQIRTANINEKLTSVQNQLNKKSLYESIAACYYNIISYNEQIELTRKNMVATDSLLLIVTNKFSQGQVQQKDVNDATINKFNLQDKFNQLNISLEQQYNSLKILCDIPFARHLTIQQALDYDQQFEPDMTATSQLQFRSAFLQMESAGADLRANRLLQLPVLSLLYNNAYYQNSTSRFFDPSANNNWLNSVYFGSKVTFNIPDVNHILLARNSKVNYHIARINFEHNKIQNEINNNQLLLDYQKAYSQFSANKQVFALKESNYKIAVNQYNQSILAFDKLLTSFNDMITSRLNYCSSLANLAYTKSKIDINNTIK